MGIIDYWCNAFSEDRRALWHSAIEAQGIPLRVRTADDDSFADASAMVARMDALGFDTLILPCAEVPEGAEALAYERYATHPRELEKLAATYPGRSTSASGACSPRGAAR